MTANRRHFLAAAAALTLAACGGKVSSSAPSPSAAPGDLARFMSLSAILAGYSDLDSGIGSIYLNAINADTARAAALNGLYDKAGFASSSPPATLADLEKRGVFAEVASLSIADEILQHWFSGIYQSGGAPATATWAQALAWRACSFTKPPSQCGVPGSWAKAPA